MQQAASSRWIRWGVSRNGMLLAALLLLYFAAGKLGLHFAFVHASASPVWPPTGIALAALLLFGVRVWPAVFIGAFLVNVSIAGAMASSIGVATGNTLEAVVGAWLVNRYAGGARSFDRARNFLRFAVLVGAVATPISATIGTASLVASGEAPAPAFGTIWLTWWLGDAAGALIVAPFLLLWSTVREANPLRERTSEALLLALAVGGTAAVVFAFPGLNRYPLPFLCIPPLIWAGFRFGSREVATSVAVLSAVATWATVNGKGPFSVGSENESLLLLQAFMVTIAALTFPVAALVWERKAVERERAILLEREQSARADAEAASLARDEFMAMLSHELRNPLGAISNAAQVLRAPNVEPAFAERAVDIIHRQSKHLTRLIEDLLDVARITRGKIVLQRERVNLAETAARCVALLRSVDRLQQHDVIVDVAEAWVDADPARLTQIVDNLLSNALKYTPAGGRISLQTLAEGRDAVLRVQDSGVGIPHDLLPRIFDVFTQGPRSLDRAQGGLGVGLTLAYRLVQAHGGSLDAFSEGPALGSLFTVRLPRVDAPPAAAAPAADPSHRAARRRILIIEDDPDGRAALRMQLQTAGHDVYEAATGREGIDAAARVRPDIVLLDIGLPGLDGYQVAERLRSPDGHPRLIAITGYGQPGDRERARSAGIDRHLVKPVDALELNRLLDEASASPGAGRDDA
jgi:signal transduction histidine kinase/CheY-like chemotaxis protein